MRISNDNISKKFFSFKEFFMKESSYQLGLSELLDQDLSSYEYFYSLPVAVQQKIKQKDINSFDDMQEYVLHLKEVDEY